MRTTMLDDIRIEDYNYDLPDHRIAKYPLADRDGSKLLHYDKCKVEEYGFKDIAHLLPSGSLMVFNDTKVVPARLHFQREEGSPSRLGFFERKQGVLRRLVIFDYDVLKILRKSGLNGGDVL